MPLVTITGSHIINGISGIWNSYGCPVESGEGLYLYVEDTGEETESLADLVGFDRTIKDIGVLKDKNTISELVVMLPMIDIPIEYTDIPTEPTYNAPVDPCAPCEEKTTVCNEKSYEDIANYMNKLKNPISGFTNYTTTYDWITGNPSNSDVLTDQPANTVEQNLLKFCITENAWLFTIKEQIINKILGVEDYKILSINAIKNILDTKQDLNHNNNIVKLMKNMVKYNFPPHLNWLAFPDRVPPYAMYTVEFSTTLDKQDLSNIWQGTMPDIAKNPSEEEITIEHYLSDEEIFGGFNIAEIDNIKLSVFKCKKRAANSYINALKQTTDGERKDWYQYNWPYDNFSLVELLKVEAGEVREFIEPENVADSVIIKSDGTKEYTLSKKAINEYVSSNMPYTPSLYE